MPEYPTDIAINSHRDVYLDGSNDLALVSGKENLQQSVAIAIGDAVRQSIGSTIDGTTIGLVEERIYQALDADPQVGTIHTVTVREFDRQSNTVRLDVALAENDEFSITVNT